MAKEYNWYMAMRDGKFTEASQEAAKHIYQTNLQYRNKNGLTVELNNEVEHMRLRVDAFDALNRVPTGHFQLKGKQYYYESRFVDKLATIRINRSHVDASH